LNAHFLLAINAPGSRAGDDGGGEDGAQLLEHFIWLRPAQWQGVALRANDPEEQFSACKNVLREQECPAPFLRISLVYLAQSTRWSHGGLYVWLKRQPRRSMFAFRAYTRVSSLSGLRH